MQALRRPLTVTIGLALILVTDTGCGSGSGDNPQVVITTFAPLNATDDILKLAEADLIVQAAAQAVDAQNLAIAVTDRIGNIIRVWNRNPASVDSDGDNEIAVSLARTAAYLSHGQAPLTSRTGQFISTFHFPVTFDTGSYQTNADCPECARTQKTTGVVNTPQGPLWQIDASNRGAAIATGLTNPPTA